MCAASPLSRIARAHTSHMAEDDAVWSAILPEGVARTPGDPPPPPVDFRDGYVLPAHFEKPLAPLFRDAKQRDLCFEEKNHIYSFRGVPTTTSVTALAHQFEKPFDPIGAIAGMRASRTQAWPRAEYVVNLHENDADHWDCRKGCLATHDGKTVAVVQPHSMFADVTHARMLEMVDAVRLRTCTAPREELELFAFDRALSDEEIQDKWADKGLLARNMGTEAHFQAELALNGLPFRSWEPEMLVLRDFVATRLVPAGMTAFATEKEIVCPDADLAGSIDAIVYDARAGLYHIIDFKRSDKLQKDLWGFGKMKAPFGHLDSSKGAGYALQLSIYQYVLEREYGLPIGDRVLLSLHPDAPFATSVPYLRAETEYIMNRRFALVRARAAAANEDAALRCAATGAPCADAVRLEDGRVVMERVALLRGLAHTAAQDVRDRFEARVAALEEPVELDRAQCTAWRRRMPQEGLVPF